MFVFKEKITVDFDPDNILGGDKMNEAQKTLVHLVASKSDPYVPWLSGDLRNSAKENKKSITYSPYHGGSKSYANIQWRENAGMGKEGVNRGGLRGSKWTERMWQDNSKEIVREIARIIGG